MSAYEYDARIEYVSGPGTCRGMRLKGKPVDRIHKAIKNCRATTRRNINKMKANGVQVLSVSMWLMPRSGGDSSIWYKHLDKWEIK